MEENMNMNTKHAVAAMVASVTLLGAGMSGAAGDDIKKICRTLR